jgi:hypothetical protein
MARRTVTDCWFVSVETPKLLGRRSVSARQTETFPTEAEAKRHAKDMLSNRNKIFAGTLVSAPVRRFISGSEIDSWIKGEGTNPN